jgi:hypothetical protein
MRKGLNRNNNSMDAGAGDDPHNDVVTCLVERMGHGGVRRLAIAHQHHAHIVIAVTHKFPLSLL